MQAQERQRDRERKKEKECRRRLSLVSWWEIRLEKRGRQQWVTNMCTGTDSGSIFGASPDVLPSNLRDTLMCLCSTVTLFSFFAVVKFLCCFQISLFIYTGRDWSMKLLYLDAGDSQWLEAVCLCICPILVNSNFLKFAQMFTWIQRWTNLILVVNGQVQCDLTSLWMNFIKSTNLLGLMGDLIRIWWSKFKVTESF